jgi:hypothetical protein
MKDIIVPHYADWNALVSCYACPLGGRKKGRVEIETRNALRRGCHWKSERFVVYKYSRRDNLSARLKPPVFE